MGSHQGCNRHSGRRNFARWLGCVLIVASSLRAADGRELGIHEAPDLEAAPSWFQAENYPGAVERPDIRAHWIRGLRHEDRGDLHASADAYTAITIALPDSAFAYWRTARNYWRIGDALPDRDLANRVRYFEVADEWAQRGLEIDPDCAPCMLYRVASLGRLATSRGLRSGARDARTIADLLDRAIALEPDHSDGDRNSTLANLYYASSSFYRTVPDWRILKWLIGVRGDKERALRDIRQAVALSGHRIDYQVELGAVLLCLGTTKGRVDRVEEGREALAHAFEMETWLPSDEKDLSYARMLLEDPAKSCSYTRDGFVQVEQARAGF